METHIHPLQTYRKVHLKIQLIKCELHNESFDKNDPWKQYKLYGKNFRLPTVKTSDSLFQIKHIFLLMILC